MRPGKRDSRTQPVQAMGRKITGGFGQKEAKRGWARSAAARLQVVMPDEGEREKSGLVFERGASDGGQGVGTATDFGAWENGRKRMLEIESGRKSFNLPSSELALQHTAKLFGEILALAHAGAMNGLGPIEIEESETAGLAAEFLNDAIEDAGGMALDGHNAARDAAGFVPNFDGQAAGTNFQGIAASEERDGIFAVFESGRAAAGTEKRLDGGQEEFGVGTGGNVVVQEIVVAAGRKFSAKK